MNSTIALRSAPEVAQGTLWSRPDSAPIISLAKSLGAAFTAHYAVRTHRVELAVTSLALCYLGGAVMFWFHALYRGEAGPAISNSSHWLLDSTLGFVALTPVIAVLLPLCRHLVTRPHVRPVVLGALFALVTTPGPLAHDALAGAGTTLADLAVSVFGYAAPTSASVQAVSHSAGSKMLAQLLVGALVYVVLAGAVQLGLRTAAVRAMSPAQH
jgi:hypothetical protein